MNALFARNGRDAVMGPFDIPPVDLSGALAGVLRIGSFERAVVAVPHKMVVLELCGDLMSRAWRRARSRRSVRDGPCWMASWGRFFSVFFGGRADRPPAGVIGPPLGWGGPGGVLETA